jgi:hypothetical protein
MSSQLSFALLLGSCLALTPLYAADKPPSGDMATVIVVSNIYVGADTTSNRLDQMTPGRELLVIEHNGNRRLQSPVGWRTRGW